MSACQDELRHAEIFYCHVSGTNNFIIHIEPLSLNFVIFLSSVYDKFKMPFWNLYLTKINFFLVKILFLERQGASAAPKNGLDADHPLFFSIQRNKLKIRC